jgi:hypothetical protein
VDLLRQNRDHDLMVKRPETVSDVAMRWMLTSSVAISLTPSARQPQRLGC